MRLLVLLVWMLAPVRAQAQCSALPSFTSLPDEAPALATPAAAIIARATAIEELPDTARNWATVTFELAEAYRATGAVEDEIRTWAHLIERTRDHPRTDEMLYHLGRALFSLGRATTARTVFAVLLADHPRSPYVEAVNGAFREYYAAQGDLDAALQFFSRAARTPGRWAAYVGYRTAWLRAAIRDPGAAAEFDHAVSLATQIGVFCPPGLTRALSTERPALVALSACPPP